MKKAKSSLSISIILLFLLISPKESLASSFPAVTGGPGLIHSDSPLYVFDRLYQKGKLFLAFTPEKRAEVRNAIMGERMAEVKIAFEKGDRNAMGLALLELTDEGRKIEADLKAASLNGVNVSTTSKTISDSLRFYRKVLAEASLSTDEDMSWALESARYSLLSSKMVVEEFLMENELAEAIQNDIDDEGETAVLGVQARSERIERKLGALENRAQKQSDLEAAKLKKQELREKRKEAVEKRKKLIDQRKQKLKETREALKRAREAAKGFVDTRKEEQDLEVPPVSTE